MNLCCTEEISNFKCSCKGLLSSGLHDIVQWHLGANYEDTEEEGFQSHRPVGKRVSVPPQESAHTHCHSLQCTVGRTGPHEQAPFVMAEIRLAGGDNPNTAEVQKRTILCALLVAQWSSLRRLSQASGF